MTDNNIGATEALRNATMVDKENGIMGILEEEPMQKPYKRTIKFYDYLFHFAVNPNKRVVHGWVEIKTLPEYTIQDGLRYIYWARLLYSQYAPLLKNTKHDAEVICSDEDNFDPLVGISVCLLKLINKIEQRKHKPNKRQLWNDFKAWLAGE